MKQLILGAAMIMLSSSCTWFSSSNETHAGLTTKKIVTIRDGLKSYEYQLKNGLTVVLTPNKKAPTASVYHWVKVGSVHEKKGITGIAHLFEHMMFRPLNEGDKPFFAKVKELGGSANANTRFASTVYTTTAPNNKLPSLLEYEAARFKNLKVTDKLLDLEREAVRSEYSTKLDASPVFDLWFEIYALAFPDTPYEWGIVGFREDLNKITAKDCNDFFDKYYKAKNIGLFVAGDFDQDEILELIKKQYGTIKPGEQTVLPKLVENPKKMIRGVGAIATPNKYILMGYRIPEINRDNSYQLNILNHIMYDSSYSLYDRKVIDEKKIVSSGGGFSFSYVRKLFMTLGVLYPNKTEKELIRSNQGLIKMLGDLDPKEYDAYKKEYQVGLYESLERNESLNSSLAFSWGKLGDTSQIIEYSRVIPKLSKSELVAFTKKFWSKNNLVVVKSKKRGRK